MPDCAAAGTPDPISEAVQRVAAQVGSDLARREARVLDGIMSLGRTIADLHAEVAMLRSERGTPSWFPDVGDELDAVVAHTAGATDAILGACEALDRLSLELSLAGAGGPAEVLTRATRRIYEACSFQDITGQRISKVVAALQAVDARVAELLPLFTERPDSPGPPRPGVSAAMPRNGESMLRGPQPESVAMPQSEVDRLLATSG